MSGAGGPVLIAYDGTAASARALREAAVAAIVRGVIRSAPCPVVVVRERA